MDSSTLQAQVDALTAQVSTDQTALANDEAALATASAELAQITLINQLEALTADEVTAISAALSTDPQNINGISLSIPTAAASTTTGTSPDEPAA